MQISDFEYLRNFSLLAITVKKMLNFEMNRCFLDHNLVFLYSLIILVVLFRTKKSFKLGDFFEMSKFCASPNKSTTLRNWCNF